MRNRRRNKKFSITSLWENFEFGKDPLLNEWERKLKEYTT